MLASVKASVSTDATDGLTCLLRSPHLIQRAKPTSRNPIERDKNVYASIAAYMKFLRNPLVPSAQNDVRFGSLADISSASPRMSALPPKADIRQRIEHVCFVPKADIARHVV